MRGDSENQKKAQTDKFSNCNTKRTERNYWQNGQKNRKNFLHKTYGKEVAKVGGIVYTCVQ